MADGVDVSVHRCSLTISYFTSGLFGEILTYKLETPGGNVSYDIPVIFVNYKTNGVLQDDWRQTKRISERKRVISWADK